MSGVLGSLESCRTALSGSRPEDAMFESLQYQCHHLLHRMILTVCVVGSICSTPAGFPGVKKVPIPSCFVETAVYAEAMMVSCITARLGNAEDVKQWKGSI